LKDFDYPDGAHPNGDLVQASDGKLYGMTTVDGSAFGGTIFSYDPATLAFTKLKDLGGTNGSGPNGSLIQASDGKLYGMTIEGGDNDEYGVTFSYDPADSAFTKVIDLTIQMELSLTGVLHRLPMENYMG
jgi:uncharacterized repeat protein (TIGR03803 family)